LSICKATTIIAVAVTFRADKPSAKMLSVPVPKGKTSAMANVSAERVNQAVLRGNSTAPSDRAADKANAPAQQQARITAFHPMDASTCKMIPQTAVSVAAPAPTMPPAQMAAVFATPADTASAEAFASTSKVTPTIADNATRRASSDKAVSVGTAAVLTAPPLVALEPTTNASIPTTTPLIAADVATLALLERPAKRESAYAPPLARSSVTGFASIHATTKTIAADVSVLEIPDNVAKAQVKSAAMDNASVPMAKTSAASEPLAFVPT
jgi:hypothetical protein